MRIPHSPFTAAAIAAIANLAALGALQAAPPEGWKLVFQDNFDGTQLDTSKWSTTMEFIGTHGPRYHNEFYLSYTMDDDVVVSGGVLSLSTQRRTVTGPESPGTFDYTQGLVSSHDKFAFTQGYIEIRAKYPGGKGLWPCLWLMPQQQGWPPEFDIAEYYGSQHTMHYGLAHGGLYNPTWDSTWDNTDDYEGGWHTYSLEWSPDRAVWKFDGKVRKTINASYVPEVPMYVILSNSVSSVYGPSGVPDETTVFPNYFLIDYVRVYQATPQGMSVPVSAPVVEEAPPAKPEPVPTPLPPATPTAVPPVDKVAVL